ncbi:hypothetical protein L7F22_047643 [Adiantum nelumboides]|nr:hypothetical protein [Adiantum nelumboides]
MAQWWHASPNHQLFHQHWSSYNAIQTMGALSSIAARSYLFPTALDDVFLVPNSDKGPLPVASCPSISCFCDDDPLIPEHLFDKEGGTFTFRTKLEIRYSPWAVSMMDGFGKADKRTPKQFTGGPTGGGNGGNDDDGGDGGGGGGDDGGNARPDILPLLTIAFAAFHLGYCIAVWVKDETLDIGFFRTGICLFLLLAVAAIRMNNQSGLDAYILGLGASVGVMFWTGKLDDKSGWKIYVKVKVYRPLVKATIQFHRQV